MNESPPEGGVSVGSVPQTGESWASFYSRLGPSRESFDRFRTIIYHYYMRHEREFSWRTDITPYRVVVSEIMLQQTQTTRVAQKFADFVHTFPDFKVLADARFSEVLARWKGLGYNRRARYLQELARIVVDEYDNRLPQDPDLLVRLPGIGPATAASISAFAFNRPVPFIETNIRTVFIHFFFDQVPVVHDREIMPLVEATMDERRPREWFYALMDYGVMLKKTIGNLNRKSRHYARQSAFAGSDRQLRGRILQLLLDRQAVERKDFGDLLDEPHGRVERVLNGLCDESIVVERGGLVSLD